ncbi:MAG: PEP-CTERM sorting domain-containing protein, partial [Leptolyngbyaceae cyanobacterium bins.59]|nr:PEP-CTERM sorting domain-containing protein [Leptolyngbyaceae cyanobacterium bins.59]
MSVKALLKQTFTRVLNLSVGLAVGASASMGFGVKPADAASLLVGNTDGNNVVLFDSTTGQFQKEFIAPGSGGLLRPDDLVLGPDGNLYISSGGDSGTGKILRYNSQTGQFIDVFAEGGIRPYGIAFGPDGYLYVSSFRTDEILRFDATTGTFVDVFATGTKTANGLNGPNDLLFTPDGKLLVSTQGSVALGGGTISFRFGFESQVISYDIATKQSTVLVNQPAPAPGSGFVSFLGLALGPT